MEDKIIKAALEEMKVHSLRFTMDDLTKRLHISKTSLYKTVGSKDNLIHIIINFLIASFEAEEKKIRDKTVSVREKVSNFVDEYSKMFNFLERGIYDDLQTLYPAEWQRCEDFRRKKINTLLSFARYGMMTGEFRLINSAVLQRCLLMMSALLADSDFLNDNNLTYAQAIDSLRDLVFYGILKRD